MHDGHPVAPEEGDRYAVGNLDGDGSVARHGHRCVGGGTGTGTGGPPLTAAEIAVVDATPGLNLSSNSGDYTSSGNLVFNCEFDQTAADGTNIALTQLGLVNLDFVSGSSKP